MSELTDAFEGAAGLIAGGLILLMFASAIGQSGVLSLSMWGILYIVVGVLVLVTLAVVAISVIIGGRK